MDNRSKVKQEILSKLTFPVHGIFLLSPRVGKTALGIDIIKKQKCKKILWVTPSVKLRDVDIPEEFSKWKAKKYVTKTDIICYKSLIGYKGDYDLVLLDEIQSITENNTQGFFNGDIKYKSIVGLTGTLPKHQEKLEIIDRLKLDILEEISIDDAVEQDLIADYKINVLEVQLDSVNKNIKAGNKAKPFMTTEEANYRYLSKQVNKMMFVDNKQRLQFAILNRLRFLYKSPTKLETAKKLIKKLDGRTLVFTGSIDHAEDLSPYTYHSKSKTMDDLNNFLNGKIDLLACVNAGGVGFTYENVDNFIIVQADSNKSGGFIQKLARSLLKQKNYKASIWIISLVNTQDEVWVKKALEELDQSKIEYTNVKNFKL